MRRAAPLLALAVRRPIDCEDVQAATKVLEGLCALVCRGQACSMPLQSAPTYLHDCTAQAELRYVRDSSLGRSPQLVKTVSIRQIQDI